MLEKKFFFFANNYLTFSTLKKFGFGTPMDFRDTYKFHHFQVILAPLVLLKWLYLKLGRFLYSVTYTKV